MPKKNRKQSPHKDRVTKENTPHVCKRSRYKSLSSPPYRANDCQGETKLGNNGKFYMSTNVNGNFKWIKLRYDFLDPSFVYDTETQFNLKQTFFSSTGRDFLIQDQKGNPFLRVDGIKSIRGNVKIYDVRDGENNHIYTILPHLFALNHIMTIERAGTKNEVNNITFRSSLFTCDMSRRGVKIYHIKGDFVGLNYHVYDNRQQEVAKFGRNLKISPIATDNSQMKCDPGTDTLCCLIGMVCIHISQYLVI